MHLMFYDSPTGGRIYTLKKRAPTGEVTKSAHPVRFSPEDPYSRHRLILKKRFGLVGMQRVDIERTTDGKAFDFDDKVANGPLIDEVISRKKLAEPIAAPQKAKSKFNGSRGGRGGARGGRGGARGGAVASGRVTKTYKK